MTCHISGTWPLHHDAVTEVVMTCHVIPLSLRTDRRVAELGMLPNDVGVYYPWGLPQAAATLPSLLRDRCVVVVVVVVCSFLFGWLVV